ncbi:MAG: EAL domain-containing protein [Chloroflexi bacterium]|nr:EAL domain-containing protein [Chloroflexota bacterium]
MRKQMATLAPLLAVLAVGSASAIGLRALDEYQAVRDDRSLTLESASARANLISATEWEAIASGTVSEELSALKVAQSEALRASLASAGNDPGLADAGEAYLAAVDEEFALLEQGKLDEAAEIDEARVDPSFEALHETMDEALSHAQVEHDRAQRVETFGSAAISLGGALLIAALLWRVAQTKRRADVMEAEQAALRASESRFRPLVQNAMDMITVIDAATYVRYQSPSSAEVLGRDAATIEGRLLQDLIHPDDRASFLAYLDDENAHSVVPLQTRMLHAGGDWRSIEIRGTNLLDDPNVAGYVLNARDITARVELEEQLRHQAFHDPVTGLANRARFMDRLDHALARIARRAGPLSVLFLDVDNFKTINDTLGHATGDRVLVALAQRLTGCLRPDDTLARFGGDEFAVLLEDASGSDARTAGERILDALRTPFLVAGHELFVRVSVGAVASAFSDEEPEDLLRNADVAMYAAKARGKARVELYEPGMQAGVLERFELLGDLERALERGEFVVFYQPTVILSTAQVTGVEALVRWRHPTKGLIQPLDFIYLVEETGLILRLGRWVLDQACAQAKKWQTGRPGEPPFSVAVNLSVKQLRPALVDEVAATLRASGLDPASLILEVTETAMMQDSALCETVLRSLKDLGVRIAVDDFGTGYSSLSYLSRFPIDILKIDKSFVDRIGTGDAEVTNAIVELGQHLNLEIIAEGIERAEQSASLQALSCLQGQGYYFARPMRPEELERLLHQDARSREAA